MEWAISYISVLGIIESFKYANSLTSRDFFTAFGTSFAQMHPNKKVPEIFTC